MLLLGFRRKMTALTLWKSIESAIQWIQIHHRITFATTQNSAVYLLGARVSFFPALVPRLYESDIRVKYQGQIYFKSVLQLVTPTPLTYFDRGASYFGLPI